MKKKYLSERYKPPEVEVLYVEVERGYGSSGSGSGGDSGGGATIEDWEIIPGTWD